jgi:hypothetical protein
MMEQWDSEIMGSGLRFGEKKQPAGPVRFSQILKAYSAGSNSNNA